MLFFSLFIFSYSPHHFFVSGKEAASGSYSLALKKLVQGNWSHCIASWSADLHRNLDLDLGFVTPSMLETAKCHGARRKCIITPCVWFVTVPPAEREFEVCSMRNSLCWNQTAKWQVLLHVMSSAKVFLCYCLVIFFFFNFRKGTSAICNFECIRKESKQWQLDHKNRCIPFS